MIKGIIFFEQGGLQVIGELNSLAGVIATLKDVLPQLEQQEAQRVIQQLSDAELEKIVAARKEAAANTGETKKL